MNTNSAITFSRAAQFTVLFSTVMALILPIGFFAISYKNIMGVMETEAEINSELISKLVQTNPELWQFETIRLSELLARRPRSGVAETRRLFDSRNVLIAESTNPLTSPLIHSSHEITDGGEIVGRLEVSRSINVLMLKSLVLALFGLFFGLVLHRWLPFNEIIATGRKLQETNDFLKKVMEGSTNSLVVLDPDGTIKTFNARFEALTGFSAADLQGRHFTSLFSGDHLIRVTAELRKIMSGEHQKVLFEADFIHQNELTLHLFCGAVPLMSDGVVSGTVLSLDDITERIEAEDERLDLERKLQQTQKLESLGVLAGGIAHDFNNILTIILGYCYVFKDEVAAGSTHAEYLQKIEEASNRAADLCRQMLSYAGKHEILHEPVNVTLLVDDIVKMLHSGIKKNVTLEVVDADNLQIVADSSQIQQVVMNLIINGAEAIGNETGVVQVAINKVQVLAEHPVVDISGRDIRPGHYACLKVSDNGCGMDETTQIRIFEPFFTTKFTGRGLGMSSTLGIIKSHDGALQLSSIPGAGSTFKVYLPLPSEITLDKNIVPESHTISAKGIGTVLLADDEKELQVLGSLRLKALGYVPIIASNGREALTIFKNRQEEIDLILLDLLMPEMDGIETYHHLRDISKTIPIVFCSGCSKNELSIDILEDAHTDFIKKPYKPEQLQATLKELLC